MRMIKGSNADAFAQLLTLLLLVLAMTQSAAADPIRVALINDAECTDAKSREAAWKVISQAPNLKAAKIPVKELLANLDAYDVYIFPGGTGSGQAKTVGIEGGKALSDSVKGGKGFIAICAGGYYVAEGWSPETKSLELVNAKLFDDTNWARGEQMITVKSLDADGETTHTMWFENGPIFAPAGRSDMGVYTPLVRYVTDLAAKGAPTGMMAGHDAVIAGEFGKGRVVAFGPHPELSPALNHWLTNAISWTALGEKAPRPSVESVLEGKKK